MNHFQNLMAAIAMTITGLLAGLLVAEALYRWQVVDFYAGELESLNVKKNESLPSILFFGDSFTAQNPGYVGLLREKMPDYQLVNAAISGTGIYETSYIASRRLKAFKPKTVVFQLYTGNDLIDIRHPLNYSTIGATRNIYWWLCDRLHILRFINYKLASYRSWFGSTIDEEIPSKTTKHFSVDEYALRSKLYLTAEPDLINNSVLLRSARKPDMEVLTSELLKIINSYDRSIRTLIVVIPHCSQLNDVYLNRFLALGARFESRKAHLSADYPFVTALRNKFADRKEVTVLNPLSLMQATDSVGNRLYYENDPHLNENGNQLIFKFLYPYLSNRNP